MNKIKIVVIDDHPLIREGVTRSIDESTNLEMVAEGGSSEDAFRLVSQHLPDIICLDISMPGGGINTARWISAKFPAVKIVMLTISEDDEDVTAALEAGATGYILKGVGATELVDVLTGVAEGQSYIAPELAVRLLVAKKSNKEPVFDPFDSLTKREEQVLHLVASGLSNKEVGQALDLREKSVKHYMTSILQKLGVRNRVEATLIAKERGLV